MQGSATEEFLNQRKLCGFFSVVLSVNSANHHEKLLNDLSETLPFGTRCHLFRDSSDELGFRTEEGIVLSLIPNSGKSSLEDSTQVNSWDLTPDLGKVKGFDGECGSSRKKRRKIGLVHGSMSVIHQLNVLTTHKCLEIFTRIVRVSVRDDGDARAVVLVDVYLPLALWSGWQFPKSGALAASLFRHLSCDWEQRNLMLGGKDTYCKFTNEDDASLWNHSDCHVLGCKVHFNISGHSKKRLFELHEIFKSLPGIAKEGKIYSTRIMPVDPSLSSGIWEVSDDVLTNIITALGPKDLVRVAATCRHLRVLAVSIMPCMKLKLFPHQQAAVEWMLLRERDPEVLAHPLFMDFLTEDEFHFYINVVSGEVVTGIAPTVTDFRGGMFCDEPGLGKTITALSLILKTQGTLADPPNGLQVIWCTHNDDKRCGYYELSADNFVSGNSTPSWKRFCKNGRRGQICLDKFTPIGNSKSSSKIERLMGSDELCLKFSDSCPTKLGLTSSTDTTPSLPVTRVLRCSRSLSRVKRNLLGTYEGPAALVKKRKVRKNVIDMKHISNGLTNASLEKGLGISSRLPNNCKKPGKASIDCTEYNETWVQCDACHKWRKLPDTTLLNTSTAWFCSMNSDPLHQNCAIPEESWDCGQSIKYLPGFCTKGTPGGKEQNVSFFASVLKEHYTLINSETKKALTWLAKLSQGKLLEMETIGLTRPVLDTHTVSVGDTHGYHKIFQAFGLIRRVEKGTIRWYYPLTLDNLTFDVVALQIALTKPLDLFRLYLSRATLIVVPANLVDHWKTQIQKHIRPGHLRVYVWTDHKKPSAHNLAWDYDVVITTFNRLSAEWGPRKRSPLMQVHWLRVMLDEGHTLGSSLSLANKMQMAISLMASNWWLLIGTPTPNTPNSQVSHLQPMLKFLHEETYGQNQKSWEAGILRPFEAEMEEGRSRLLQLLQS